MTEDTTDWTELREFAAVGLTQSYVLSWQLEETSLMIDLDLHLRPEHPFYEKPRPSEKGCFRAAFLEFPTCTQVLVAGKMGQEPLAETIQSLAPGLIMGLRRTGDGRYEILGKFGTAEILADRPLLRIKDMSV
jgi:hypothetical protein